MSIKNHKTMIMRIFMILSILFIFFLSFRIVNETRHQYEIANDSLLGQELVIQVDNLLVEADPKKELKLIFGGDIMLSRTVNAKMEAYNDYAWPARLISSSTAEADFSIFNLESPFLRDSNYNVPTGSFAFKANPLSVQTLNLLGADVVSLANNHMLNAGTTGISDTLDVLSENNILSVGAGLNEEQARKPAIIEKNGWKLAFLSYAYPNDHSVATKKQAGIATMDIENLREDIEALKGKVDLIIILMHAGIEYVSVPQKNQVNFAHQAIDFGADLVVGHHPHWPQTWEIYNDKAIFYSLGNFIFDQMWSQGTSQGILAEIIFQSNLSAKAKLIPIVIKDYGQVRLWPEGQDQADFWSVYGLKKSDGINWGNAENYVD